MLIARTRVVLVSLALVTTLVSGCGGEHGSPSRTPGTSRRMITPATPAYTMRRLRSTALSARDVGAGTRPVPVNITGFERRSVPSCADTVIGLPGSPDTSAQQISPSDPRSTAPGHAEQDAVFGDATAAAAFAHVRSKVSACPAKRHVRSRRLKARQVTLPYDATWRTTTDDIAGWTHLQGFEKRTYSPSSSVINVIYEVYDYAYRGNALIAALYFTRVRPTASPEPIRARANALFRKRLAAIG